MPGHLTVSGPQEYASKIGQLLLARGATVTAAESCTGGAVAEALTSVAGASSWFHCGFITYSNRAKSELIGVPGDVIDTYGAVSEPVVIAMAHGVLIRAAADYSVAISGIAGPDGGSMEKPVGTVWLAWAGPCKSFARRCYYQGDRQQVRQQAVLEALTGLIECIEDTV